MSMAFRSLTKESWRDFEKLFGERGACGGCWCMLWRMKRAEYDRGRGQKNKAAMKRLVDSGATVGLLAYIGTDAVGWCAVAPRKDYPALARSRVLKPIDDKPVWSIACLFISKSHRNRGVSVALLKAAIAYVADRGGRIVEGYPVEPKKPKMPDVFAWTGTASAFRKAGYKECARGSESRPIMRYQIPKRAEGRESAAQRCNEFDA
jgi:GNAT superfamily N-acetyltransferase